MSAEESSADTSSSAPTGPSRRPLAVDAVADRTGPSSDGAITRPTAGLGASRRPWPDASDESLFPPSSTEVLRALLHSADAQLLIVLDDALRIQQISSGVLPMLGWTPQEVEGWPFVDLLSGSGTALETLTGAEARGGGAGAVTIPPESLPPLIGRARLRTKEGFTLWVRLRSCAVGQDVPNLHGTVVVATDVSLVAAAAPKVRT